MSLLRPGGRDSILATLEGDSPLSGQRARRGERPPAQSFASPAEALLIEEAELGLCGRISLIGGEPENSRCRPLDLRKPAAAGASSAASCDASCGRARGGCVSRADRRPARTKVERMLF